MAQFGIGGGGPQQIIGGQSYTMYSPQWYAAMDADKVKNAGVAGTAAGAFSSAALGGLKSAISGFGGTGSTSSGATAIGSGSPSGAASGFTPSGSGGVSSGSYVPQIQMPDQTKASASAFASAKDKVGQTSRASLDSLRGELGASGMLGGGAEAQDVRDVIQSGAGELGQVSRDQAGKEADIAGDFAKTGYAGAITQRGQDISAQEAQARLAQEKELQASRLSFEQQQLASQQQLSMLQLALSGLKAAY